MIESSKKVEFLTYENVEKGLRIQYSSDWIKEEDNKNINFVTFFSQLQNLGDKFQERLLLRSSDLPRFGMNLSEYMDYFYNNTLSKLKNFSIIHETSHNILGEKPAYNITYSFYSDSLNTIINSISFVVIEDNKYYTITYFAEPSRFYDYLPTIQKMIDSFKFFKLELYDDIENQIQIKYPSTWNINNSSKDGITFSISENLFPKDNLTIYSYNSTGLDSIITTKK